MRIVIVDDDPIVCRSLTTIVEANPGTQVVGVCHDGDEAVNLSDTLSPDVLLMDIRMNRMSGLEAAEIILKRDKDAKIIFLTTFKDTEYIIKALRIGAKGFILKQNYESIIPAIKSVLHGQRVFGDEIADKIPALLAKASEKDFGAYNLTEKETDILRHVAEGFSNREIAQILYFSEGTVRNYISAILDKLSLRDRTQLAVFFYKHKES